MKKEFRARRTEMSASGIRVVCLCVGGKRKKVSLDKHLLEAFLLIQEMHRKHPIPDGSSVHLNIVSGNITVAIQVPNNHPLPVG